MISKDVKDFWFINSLVTLMVEKESTEGAFSLARQIVPPGFTTPYHTHAAYGEGFTVLAGEVTFICDGEHTVLGENGFIYVPGTKAHGFRVTSAGPATMIIVSPPAGTFSAFVREMGEPATTHELPVPARPDMERLRAISAKYGSVILGPLPE